MASARAFGNSGESSLFADLRLIRAGSGRGRRRTGRIHAVLDAASTLAPLELPFREQRVLAFAAHDPRVRPEPSTLLEVGTLVEPSVRVHPKLRHRTDMGRPKMVQQQEGVRLLLGELVQAVRDEYFSRTEGVGACRAAPSSRLWPPCVGSVFRWRRAAVEQRPEGSLSWAHA